MPFLTATPLPSGAVRLDFGDPAGLSVPSIMRFDANGNNQVRSMPGQLPLVSPGSIVDYEAALNGPVVYTGAGVTVRTSFAGVLDGPRLVAPLAPAQSLVLAGASGYDAARSTGATVHQVPGRPDPIVATGTLSTRAGSLGLDFADHAGLRAAEQLAGTQQVLLLKVPDHNGMDLFFATLGTSVDYDTDSGLWTLSVDYVEVRRPTVGINAGTWTVAAMANTYATGTALASAYQNIAGAAINDTTWETV